MSFAPLDSGLSDRVCRFPLPSLPTVLWHARRRSWWLYLAGASFAIGWWILLDAFLISSKFVRDGLDQHPPSPPPPVRMSFIDLVPAVLGTLSLLWISLLDKTSLSSVDDGLYSAGGELATNTTWSRLSLFAALALLAADVAGSIAVLVVKYLVPEFYGYEWYGAANVGQALGIALSTGLVWSAATVEEETEYTLRI